MSNINTISAFYNLPAQVISVNTEVAALVPAAGLYPSLPSPTLAAGSGLAVRFSPDIAGSMSNDCHAFYLRLAGKLNTGASLTFLAKLYQVPASIIAAGTQATVGNDHVVAAMAASTAFSGAGNFAIECMFLWDSVSSTLNGQTSFAQINNVVNAVNSGSAGVGTATTQVTSVAQADLNFMPSFTFGTANAANSVTITEFAIDRL